MISNTVSVENGSFIINKKPFFLYSGEIHYFRIPQKYWGVHIEKAKKAGLNSISSYIPWNWHESEEGQFDFEGKTHPQRNLIRFLDLVKKAGLYFVARVGPVSNAELVQEGIPQWLLKNHPEVHVQRTGVNFLPHAMLLSYLNPVFQGYVEKWYGRILPVVAQRQVHRGGNIVMVQLCNEIGMIHWLHKASDDSRQVTDFYQKFLKQKYSDVDQLNETYSTRYGSFEEVRQPQGEPGMESFAQYFDWALFYRRYYAYYFYSLSKMAKSHSISVPLSANIPQFYDYDVRGRGVFSPMTTSLYRDFSLLSPSTVFGGAYQMRRLDFENFHDVAITSEMVRSVSDMVLANDLYAHRIDFENFHDIALANESVRQVSSGPVPVICAELQTGIMRDRPRLYPADVELNVKTSVAHGLNGINCYMFSSGENLPGMGAFGSFHDWQAPVGLEGQEKDHLLPLKEWGRFIKKYGSKLAESGKLTDTTLGFYLPYYATEYFSGPWAGRLESARTNYFFDGIGRLLQLAGFNFSISDLMRQSAEELARHKSICLFSLEFMDEETQKKLIGYLRKGGKLLLGPRVPFLNLHGKKCTFLADFLGISLREINEKEMLLWNKIECSVDFPIQSFKGPNAKILMKTAGGTPCVLNGRQGQGQWLAYGFGMMHVFDYQVRMVREWMSHLGVRPQVEVDPWDVHSVVRWGGEQGFLFLFNYHDTVKKGKAELRLDLKDQMKTFVHPSVYSFRKSFQLERRSGTVIPLQLKKNKIVEV